MVSLASLVTRRAFGRLAGSRTQSSYSAAALEEQYRADRKSLLEYFPSVVRDAQDAASVVGIPQETEWIGRALNHTVPRGRMFRGCSALNAFRELNPEKSPHLGKALGLTMEMMHAVFSTIDDIVDHAVLRRGRPCWYTLPDVGLHAVNDALLIEMAVFQMLRRHFETLPGYLPLVHLFSDTTFRALISQNYECHNGQRDAAKFDQISFEMHADQARYKISYYMFYTPVAAAMYTANICDPKRYEDVLKITEDIGMLFTVMDDYDDCFEPEALSGKSKGDIRNGKCTWPIAEAKRRANPEQRALLKANFGFDDDEKVAVVGRVFEQLGVKEAAEEYKDKAFDSLRGRIERQDALPPSVLHYALDSMRHPFQKE